MGGEDDRASGTTRVLNAWDRSLLDRHLDFYRALHLGERRPETAAQAHFIKVCLGDVPARTQHEIAYVRYLAVQKSKNPMNQPLARPEAATPVEHDGEGTEDTDPPAPDVVPTPEAEAAVDDIEDALIAERLGRAARATLERLRGAYRSGRARAGSASTDADVWLNAIVADRDFAASIERWMGDNWNTLSNPYTRAIDGNFADGLKAGSDYVSPLWHRLVDGHSPFAAFERAKAALPDDTMLDEIWGTATALFSDFTSTAGLPVVELNQGQVETLRAIGDRIALSEGWIVDALSWNLNEMVSTTVPVLSLVLAWREDDRNRFEELMGGLAVAGLVSGNPLLLLIETVLFARAFTLRRKGVVIGDVVGNVARGSMISAVFLSASAVVSGPVWVGILVGIIAVIALRKAGREVSELDWRSTLNRLMMRWQPAEG